MFALIITTILVVGISALCSTTEAMLYSVSWTHIEKLKEEKRPVGDILSELRTQVDQPITAVLTLNTIANTAGSAAAGALTTVILGPQHLLWYTTLLTLLILVFGEILPKTYGVVYANQVSVILAYPLKGLMTVLKPLIFISSTITGMITKGKSSPEATEDDIRIMTHMSAKSGEIQAFEEQAITNILLLDTKTVHDIMTPRTVVFSLPIDTPIIEALKVDKLWSFSRIPVYKENNEDIVGIVTRRDLSMYYSNSKDKEPDPSITLESIMQEITFVPESQSLDKILLKFLNSRSHLFAVLDEYGGLAGVISLEDILEEMLGHEIIDDSDMAADLQETAKKTGLERRRKGIARRQYANN